MGTMIAQEVLRSFREQIASIDPRVEDGVPFENYPSGDLEESKQPGMMRKFQVRWGADYETLPSTGIIKQVEVRATCIIFVRYVWPGRSMDDLQDMAAVDREDIVLALAENPPSYPSADDGEVYAVNGEGTPVGLAFRGGNATALLQVPLDVYYRKDKAVRP